MASPVDRRAVGAAETLTLVRDLRERTRLVPDFPTAGVLFRDLSALYRRPRLVTRMATVVAGAHPGADAVVAVEARGFLLGMVVAQVADLPLVLARKAGKLPPPVRSVTYDLEYGTDTLQVQPDGLPPGTRALIVDDVLATGGTLAGVARLVERCDAVVTGLAVLLELVGLGGRDRLSEWPVFALDRVGGAEGEQP